MRVAGYIRTSRGNQMYNINSLVAEMREYIEAVDGWTLVDIFYDEWTSGKIKDRAGFRELIDAVKANKVDIIVARNLNRLIRSVEINEIITILKDHNVKLYMIEYGGYISESALYSLGAFMKMQREMDIREKELERKYQEIVDNTAEEAENLYHHLYYGYNDRTEESVSYKKNEVIEISAGKYHATLALTSETWREITNALREIAGIMQ